MSFRHLDYDVRDHVAEITMRRDPVNAIDHALIEDILGAYQLAKADPDVRAIILTSAFENSFSAGMDLAMIRATPADSISAAISKSSISGCTTCNTEWVNPRSQP